MNLFKKYFFYFYILLLSFQIIFIAHYGVKLLPTSIPTYPYYESVALYFNGYKKSELIQYLVGVISIGLWASGIFIFRTLIEQRTKFKTFYLVKYLTGWVFMFVFLILIPALIWSDNHISYPMKMTIAMAVLGISICLPIGFKSLSRYHTIQTLEQGLAVIHHYLLPKQNDFSRLYKFLILLGYLQLVILFYEPIFQQIKIITEYWNIDEITLIDENKSVNKHNYLETIFTKVDNPPINEDSLTSFDLNSLADTQTIKDHQFQLTNEEEKFLEKNTFELHWQILSRFMIHHNSFIFIPVQEFELNRDSKEINAQYGLGFAWILSKAYDWTGGVSIDKWLRLSYSLYYIYFLFFIAVSYRLTKDWGFTAIVFLISMSVINARGYDFLLLPPGESPWRHFFDLWVVWFLYSYGKTKNILYYCLALCFGVVSIILNPQIGIMIFIPIILVGIFFSMYQREFSWKTVASIIIGLVLALWVWKISLSADDLAMYYIDGVIGFPITTKQLLYFLSLIAVGYTLVLLLIRRTECEYILPLLFLFFYSQELLLYVVWHYNGDGLKSRAFIYILTIGLILFYTSKSWNERLIKVLWILLTVYAVTVYSKSVGKVFSSKKHYNEIFKTHVTYDWTMEKARFVSTMNPAPFENGINLIRKYSQGLNGIYIISEYDNLLPFLANKYSEMPFFDLKWYLITPKELYKSTTVLQKNKPKYLFVDTGIDRIYEKEIIDIQTPGIGYLYQESIWRVQRLKLLQRIFNEIRDEYVLVEKGVIISVYKRKDNNETH